MWNVTLGLDGGGGSEAGCPLSCLCRLTALPGLERHVVWRWAGFLLDCWVEHDSDVAEFDDVVVAHAGFDDVEGVDRSERSVDVAFVGIVGMDVELVPVFGEAGSGLVDVLGYEFDLSVDAADDVAESVLEPVVQDRVDPGGVGHDSLVEPGNSSIEAIVLRSAAISVATYLLARRSASTSTGRHVRSSLAMSVMSASMI